MRRLTSSLAALLVAAIIGCGSAAVPEIGPAPPEPMKPNPAAELVGPGGEGYQGSGPKYDGAQGDPKASLQPRPEEGGKAAPEGEKKAAPEGEKKAAPEGEKKAAPEGEKKADEKK